MRQAGKAAPVDMSSWRVPLQRYHSRSLLFSVEVRIAVHSCGMETPTRKVNRLDQFGLDGHGTAVAIAYGLGKQIVSILPFLCIKAATSRVAF